MDFGEESKVDANKFVAGVILWVDLHDLHDSKRSESSPTLIREVDRWSTYTPYQLKNKTLPKKNGCLEYYRPIFRGDVGSLHLTMLRLPYRWWRLAPREIASCCRGRKASGSHGGRLGWQEICTCRGGPVVVDGRWMDDSFVVSILVSLWKSGCVVGVFLAQNSLRGLQMIFADAMQNTVCDVESICNLFG